MRWNSTFSSLARATDWSTHSSPSTRRRLARPRCRALAEDSVMAGGSLLHIGRGDGVFWWEGRRPRTPRPPPPPPPPPPPFPIKPPPPTPTPPPPPRPAHEQ